MLKAILGYQEALEVVHVPGSYGGGSPGFDPGFQSFQDAEVRDRDLRWRMEMEKSDTLPPLLAAWCIAENE